jgi:hypothetical protein
VSVLRNQLLSQDLSFFFVKLKEKIAVFIQNAAILKYVPEIFSWRAKVTQRLPLCAIKGLLIGGMQLRIAVSKDIMHSIQYNRRWNSTSRAPNNSSTIFSQ